MTATPPICSSEWTPAERMRLVAFWLQVMQAVILADDPRMPVVEKRSVQEFHKSLHQILTYPPELLERDREALQKPFDSEKMYHRVWLAF